MPVRVSMPDGSLVEFPDGMSDDQISAILRQQHPAAQPNYRAPARQAGSAPLASPINLSGGFVPKNAGSSQGNIDLSAGMIPKAQNGANGWTRVPEDTSAWKPVAEEPKGFLSSFSDSSGLSALAHPIDTIMGIPAGVKSMVSNTVDNVRQGVDDYQKTGLSQTTRRAFGRSIPIVGPALAAAQAQHDAGNDAGMAGTMAGTVAGLAGPKILKEAIPAAARFAGGAMDRVGSAATESGLDRINKTVGALQKDFDKGHNLGRGYLDAGMGTSSSMRSIAVKADTALGDVGDKIGKSYDQANGVNIPVRDVIDALAKPLRAAHDMESGFGGSGATAVLEDYAARLKPELSKAYARGGFTPRELFDLKQKLTKNINWKSTSDIESKLNNVREAQYGGLTGVLNDAVPEVEPLNQAYGDLKTLQKRASLRADTGSSPLTNFKEKGILTSAGAGIGAVMGGPVGAVVGGATGLAADSIPFRTATASGLFRGGNALSAASGRVGAITAPSSLPAVAGGAYALIDKGKDQNGYNNQNVNQVEPSTSQNANTPMVRNQTVVSADPARGVQQVDLPVLKGQALWAQLGLAKLRDHVDREPISHSVLASGDIADISPAIAKALQSTPRGQSYLIQASDLKPGSPAMKNLMKDLNKNLPAIIGSN